MKTSSSVVLLSGIVSWVVLTIIAWVGWNWGIASAWPVPRLSGVEVLLSLITIRIAGYSFLGGLTTSFRKED